MAENKPIPSISIIGAGSWATALCKIFADSGLAVHWWFHRSDDVLHFQEFGHNPRYLTDVGFREKQVKAYSKVAEAIAQSDLLLVAVPSAFVAGVFENITTAQLRGKRIISSIKGILPAQLQLVTDYLSDKYSISQNQMAVIGGPCHAEEVALEKQSYLTVASTDLAFAAQIQAHMKSRFISIATSTDIEGLEWAAVLKNVYAITCGVCHGLGFGDNFQAVLVANAMQELTLFLQHQAPMNRDAMSSAYLGDLLVTAYSTFSRNRTFGNMIGRGYSIKAAQVELGMVAEGYYAVKGLHQLREKHGIRLPIAEAIYSIIYENASAKDTISNLKQILK